MNEQLAEGIKRALRLIIQNFDDHLKGQVESLVVQKVNERLLEIVGHVSERPAGGESGSLLDLHKAISSNAQEKNRSKLLKAINKQKGR